MISFSTEMDAGKMLEALRTPAPETSRVGFFSNNGSARNNIMHRKEGNGISTR
jgi:hypothetical protein